MADSIGNLKVTAVLDSKLGPGLAQMRREVDSTARGGAMGGGFGRGGYGGGGGTWTDMLRSRGGRREIKELGGMMGAGGELGPLLTVAKLGMGRLGVGGGAAAVAALIAGTGMKGLEHMGAETSGILSGAATGNMSVEEYQKKQQAKEPYMRPGVTLSKEALVAGQAAGETIGMIKSLGRDAKTAAKEAIGRGLFAAGMVGRSLRYGQSLSESHREMIAEQDRDVQEATDLGQQRKAAGRAALAPSMTEGSEAAYKAVAESQWEARQFYALERIERHISQLNQRGIVVQEAGGVR